jgi:CpeT protein
MQFIKIATTILLVAASFNTQAQAKKVTDKDVEALYKLMQGSYSSEAQSKSDSSYFDIRLQIVPCWKNKKGEKWLYVEQAMSTTIDKPYRQRVYQLKKINDTTIASVVYTIKGGDKYYGDFKKTEPLKDVPMDSIELRQGCAVLLHKLGKKKFKGSTNKSDCESSLRGASYATSIVTVGKKKLVSWDQGFDKEGKQVWGAVKGGYQFMKLKK